LFLFGDSKRNDAAFAVTYGVFSNFSDGLGEIAATPLRQPGQRRQEASALRGRANVAVGLEREFGQSNVHGTVAAR
jgi:hypothetical protein